MSALDDYIARNINKTRGGYRPDEVETLIRQAWALGRIDKLYDQVTELVERRLGNGGSHGLRSVA